MGQCDSGIVGQRDSLRLSAIGCRLSAAIACRTVFPKAGGSGAFGARVLSVVRFAPNDGFRPQSGLVQRVVIKSTPWRQGGRLRRHFIMRPQGATITL